ncbi:MAG TPA: ABC transporter ATP-binding protein [Gammaproteobacteria bacterium]|jgi:ABC-2 type transport system ATP-binding protein|nr:ABC transporter ATP-binding protein [Gammaproteobacteria bacterium]
MELRTRTGHYAIEVSGLNKRFDEVDVVKNISFEVEHGRTYALLGANGAGKTTTLAMLLGLLIPTSGRIFVLGVDMLRDRYRALPRMNYASPYVDLPQRLTVRQNLKVYGRLYGASKLAQRIDELAAQLDLEDFIDRSYRNMSSGQKTRVALAKALLNKPEVLLMDEPTASLDPDTADRIRTYLEDYQRATRATLLLASHNMLEVERLCDKVLMMRAGRIVDRGTPRELVTRYGRNTMEEVFLDVARNEAVA